MGIGGITNEEKIHLRQKLSSHLREENYEIALQLAVLVSKIARIDYPKIWPEFFTVLAQQLQTADVLTSHRIFMILFVSLKELSRKRLPSDQRKFAEDYTAKLSDFGLAKDGPEGDNTHVSTRVLGTHGYAAPEYLMTGHLTTKSDVYTFGVVFLELLTGRRSVDKSCPSREQNLVEWGRPCLNDYGKLDRILDPRLEGQYSIKGAQKAASLAYQCLSHTSQPRPTMSAVVNILESLQNFDDVRVEPFVYIAEVDNQQEEPKQGNENLRRGLMHHKGSPRSPTIHSISSPNLSFTNRSKSVTP